MAGISIDFIDDDEFLELERCLASAEMKHYSRTSHQVEAPQAVIGFAGPGSKRPAVNSPASLQQDAQQHIGTKKTACRSAVQLFQQLHMHPQVTWQTAPAISAWPHGTNTPQTAAVSAPLQKQGLQQDLQQPELSLDPYSLAKNLSDGQQLQEHTKTHVLQQPQQQSHQAAKDDSHSIAHTTPHAVKQFMQPGAHVQMSPQHAELSAKQQHQPPHQHQLQLQSVHPQLGQDAQAQQQRGHGQPLPQSRQQAVPCLQLQQQPQPAAWQPQQSRTDDNQQQQLKAPNPWCYQQHANSLGTGTQQLDMSYMHLPYQQQLQQAVQPSCNGPAMACHNTTQQGLARMASAPAASSAGQRSATAAGAHSWGAGGATSGAAAAVSGMASGNASSNASGCSGWGRQRSHSPVAGSHGWLPASGHAAAAGAGSGSTWAAQQHPQLIQHPLAQHLQQLQQPLVQQQQQVQHPLVQQQWIQQPQQPQQQPLGVQQERHQMPAGNGSMLTAGDSSGCIRANQSGPAAIAASGAAAATHAGNHDTAVLPDASTIAVMAAATSGGSCSLSGYLRKLPPSLQSSTWPLGNGQQQQLPQQQQQQQQVVPHGKPQKQLGFHGVVRYAYNPMEVDWLCRQMLDAGPPKVIGLDIEWRPTFKTGQAPNRTALLQIAYAMDKDGRDWRPKLHGKGVMVLLLHVYYTGITPALQEILQRDEIIKVGVNISGDVCKLLADFKVEVRGTDELSDAAHGRQLRCVDGITANTECKRWSLAGLVEEVLGLELPKPNQVRLGNWERRPLSDEQKQYAALDAFASLLLHWELQALPERLTLSQQLRAAMRERAEAAIAAADDD